MLERLTDPLAALLFPQFCGSCEHIVEKVSDGFACERCWESTRLFGSRDLLCAKCGAFLADGPARSQNEPSCGQCNDHHYDLARAAGIYGEALAAVILGLKRTPQVARRVASSINLVAENNLNGASLVVPVPLSKRRLLERGFNQAALLAREVSRYVRLPLDEHSLVRKRDTPMHRAGMDRTAREITVKNAFEVRRPALVAGRSIMLVDDVLTSGSTASQCAFALKNSGAAKVTVITLARAY